MPSQVQSPAHYAAEAARLTKADKCDTRAFDDCFEMGNGSLVVAAFVALYNKDPELQRAVQRNDYYIGIDKWLVTAERVNNPLFAQ